MFGDLELSPSSLAAFLQFLSKIAQLKAKSHPPACMVFDNWNPVDLPTFFSAFYQHPDC